MKNSEFQSMDHEEIKNRLYLFAAEELDGNERNNISSHLAVCTECSHELRSLQGIINWEKGHPSVPVTEELLQESRMELRAALRQERKKTGLFREFIEQFRLPFSFRSAYILSGAALAFAGLMIGYTAGKQSGVETDVAKNSRMTNVRIVRYDPEKNEVEFSFDQVSVKKMRIQFSDEKAGIFLTRAFAQNSDAESRLRLIDIFKERFGAERAGSDEIIDALIKAAQSDENPAVRRESIAALGSFVFNRRILDAALYLLQHDDNPGVRIAAINLIAMENSLSSGNASALEKTLRQSASKDDNSYVRLKSKILLQEAAQL